VHTDHDEFVRGIERQRRLRVTYLSNEGREKLLRLCGPLYYSEGKTEADELERYYLWDFEADKGHNFLALSMSEILSIEPTEDAFSIEEVSSFSKRAERSTQGPDTVCDR